MPAHILRVCTALMLSISFFSFLLHLRAQLTLVLLCTGFSLLVMNLMNLMKTLECGLSNLNHLMIPPPFQSSTSTAYSRPHISSLSMVPIPFPVIFSTTIHLTPFVPSMLTNSLTTTHSTSQSEQVVL